MDLNIHFSMLYYSERAILWSIWPVITNDDNFPLKNNTIHEDDKTTDGAGEDGRRR